MTPMVTMVQIHQLLNGSTHQFSHFSHAAQQSLHADALPLHELLPVLPEGELLCVTFGTFGNPWGKLMRWLGNSIRSSERLPIE